MHSALVRVQNVFGFFTSVAFAVGALIAASVLLVPQAPEASVNVRNLQVVKGRPHYYSTKKSEYAVIRFDIEADLSSLFNWNTKQLFVWVTATYPSSTPLNPHSKTASPSAAPLSQAVIWDAIIPSLAQSDPPSLLEMLKHNPYNGPPPKGSKSKSKDKGRGHKAASSGTPGKLSIKNVKPKYQISDPSGHISSTSNVTLELGWSVQPWVGALTWTQRADFLNWAGLKGGISKAFDLPAIKGAAKKEETIIGKGEVPRPGGAEPVVNA